MNVCAGRGGSGKGNAIVVTKLKRTKRIIISSFIIMNIMSKNNNNNKKQQRRTNKTIYILYFNYVQF